MPGFDGTGPAGQGPMTGGGRGFCAQPYPYAQQQSPRFSFNPFNWFRNPQGFVTGRPMRGRGGGMGRGRGRGRW